MAIDGSKYYYWRGRYVATGSLKAFDLMMRHYSAGNYADLAPPVGKRRRGLSITKATRILEEEWPNLAIFNTSTERNRSISLTTRDPNFQYCEKR